MIYLNVHKNINTKPITIIKLVGIEKKKQNNGSLFACSLIIRYLDNRYVTSE